MPRDVLLSSLGTGKCFTVKTDAAATHEGAAQAGVVQARSVMSPEAVWKVVATEGDAVACENARGDAQTFPGSTRVAEVPRQGFERLVERSRAE